METAIFKEIIDVIKREKQRREWLLKGKDQDFAYDQWLFTDAPFVNELCLLVLVSLRHQVERELIWLAARAADNGKEISHQQYFENVQKLRKELRKPNSWNEKIKNRLKLESFDEYPYIEALRFLANSYKHDPSMKPNDDLLNLLKLETGVPYAPLPESDALRQGLAEFIGFDKDKGYCDITARFVDKASDFLAKVESRSKLSRIQPGRVSLNPKDFAR